MLEKWTRGAVRNRFAIIATWIVLGVFGFLGASQLDGLLTTSLTVPGSQSAQADEILTNSYHENVEGSFTVLYKFRNATDTEIQSFKHSIDVAASSIATAKVTQSRALGGYLYANIGTSFNLSEAAKFTPQLRIALAHQGLNEAMVTGPPAIKYDVTPVLSSDLKRGELIAVLLALVLLILMLGFSWAVVVPFIFAGATISLTLGIVYLLAHRFLMVLYVPNIIELIGLGLAIDYSLIIVHRFRRERMQDSVQSVEDAIVRTMQTSGRTVVLSGASVAIGLTVLLFIPVPFIRSLGTAGVVVPLVSIFCALTLQPALLSFLGKNEVIPFGFKGLMSRRDLTTGLMARIAHFVIRKPIAVALASLATLGLIASSLLWLQVTPSSLTALPANLESSKALTMVTSRIGPGIITPTQIIIDLGSPGLATTDSVKTARISLAKVILKNPEAFTVATDESSAYVDETGQFIRLFVIGQHALGEEQSKNFVDQLRTTYLPQANFGENSTIYLAGAPAQGQDLLNKIGTSFPWIIVITLLITYLILLRSFGSLILPLKAIFMDLISIAVAYGSMVLVFKSGIGSSVLGTYQLDQIEVWVLVFLFVVLFGLSMDYEVFIVSRMKEAKDRGATNNEAIVEGLSHTGGVVTSAAVILVGALSGLVFGHFAGLQELGVGLGLGILVDATIIRCLLLPSVMVLLGKWNWWMPTSIAQRVKGKASPLSQ